MNLFTDAQMEKFSEEALTYIKKRNLDFTNLSAENVSKTDTFLTRVYKEWYAVELPDMVAYEIGNIFEAEPIHHMLKTSVYPLCDILFHLESGDLESIKL